MIEHLNEKDKVYSRDDVVDYQNLSENSPGVKCCKACGKPFLPKNGKQKNCLRTHYKKCVVCGKEFNVVLSNGLKQLPVCCSKECRAKYKAFIAKSPEVMEKSKRTNLQKYGVENGAQSVESRAKISTALKSKKPIVLTCVVCGKQFEVPSGSNHKKCCSKECLHVLQSQNNHNRSIRSGYVQQCVDRMERVKQDREQGFVNSSQRPEVRKKQSEARKLFPSFVHTVESKKKISEGLLRANSDPRNKMSILAKRTLSTQEHYGVDNPFQSEEVKEKIKSTNLQKYGVEYAVQNPEIKEKLESSREQTMLKRYGVKFPNQVPEFQHKRAVTIFEKANGEDDFNYVSEYNREFQSFLSSHGIQSEFEFPVEQYNFDLHIKDSNILIELDPSVTHNVSNLNQFPFVSRDCHLQKSEAAERNKFRCIHVFDWDNWNKILMLVQPEKKVYARQCTVKQIDQRTADLFTDRFHIQGKCRGQKTNFGLYFNQELIEVMTFGTPRYAHKYKWELLRLCTKPGVKVTGGASKLFNHALKEIPELDHVISYCDKSKFNGTVYSQIGFQLIRTTEPQEIWSKEDKYITANMLRARGFDQIFNTNFGKGTDNNALMLNSGWLPVFDCGQMVFEFNRNGQ